MKKRVFLLITLFLCFFLVQNSWAMDGDSFPINSVGNGATGPSLIDWKKTYHGILDYGDYVKIDGVVYNVIYSTNRSWTNGAHNYADLQQVNQLTGIPLDEQGNPGTPLMAEMTGTEGMMAAHYTAWPGTPATWAVSNVFDHGWGVPSVIDWPYNVHDKVNTGEYLEINGAQYYVNWSSYCDGTMCPSGNVWADLQQVNLIDGTPLDIPNNPGIPLMADMTGSEGASITVHPTWPGPQSSWTVKSVNTQYNWMIPWDYNLHDIVTPGEYLEINGKYYYISSSYYCIGDCPSGIVWADLQQVNLIDGTPLDKPNNPGIPLMADMTGSEDSLITVHPTWPGTQAIWTVSNVYTGSWNMIDWPYNIHGIVSEGEYLEINGIYYGVFFSSICGSSCPPGNVMTMLQNVDQSNGQYLFTDPPYNFNPELIDHRGMEGLPIAHHSSWLTTDSDNDGVMAEFDLCPGFDDTQHSDADGVPDGCDAFPSDPNENADTDGDYIGDNSDPCPLTWPLRVDGKGDYWQGIQSVYDLSIQSGETIKVQSLFNGGPLVLDQPINLTIIGGYDCDYTDDWGLLTIIESLTIDGSSGVVVIENILIE